MFPIRKNIQELSTNRAYFKFWTRISHIFYLQIDFEYNVRSLLF